MLLLYVINNNISYTGDVSNRAASMFGVNKVLGVYIFTMQYD